MKPDAKTFIERFAMQQHPEGGYYRETYRAATRVQSEAHTGSRSAFTSIYFLLESHQYSAWHRITSDESWFFHTGCDLEIFTLKTNAKESDNAIEIHRIGQECGRFDVTIPAGVWFAARPVEEQSFSLVSCVVAPGFEFEDFELATCDQLKVEGYARHPDWDLIEPLISVTAYNADSSGN